MSTARIDLQSLTPFPTAPDRSHPDVLYHLIRLPSSQQISNLDRLVLWYISVRMNPLGRKRPTAGQYTSTLKQISSTEESCRAEKEIPSMLEPKDLPNRPLLWRASN
jgi:hypothetical protein